VDVVRINSGHDDADMWMRMKQVAAPSDRQRMLVGGKLPLCRTDYHFQSTCASVGVLDHF
jgi:hypothetical protein